MRMALVGPVYDSTELSPNSTRSSPNSAQNKEIEREAFANLDGKVASIHTEGNGKRRTFLQTLALTNIRSQDGSIDPYTTRKKYIIT